MEIAFPAVISVLLPMVPACLERTSFCTGEDNGLRGTIAVVTHVKISMAKVKASGRICPPWKTERAQETQKHIFEFSNFKNVCIWRASVPAFDCGSHFFSVGFSQWFCVLFRAVDSFGNAAGVLRYVQIQQLYTIAMVRVIAASCIPPL